MSTLLDYLFGGLNEEEILLIQPPLSRFQVPLFEIQIYIQAWCVVHCELTIGTCKLYILYNHV